MTAPRIGPNLDEVTVSSFSREWTRFDQSALGEKEAEALFDEYFRLFPWERLPKGASGADLGCGSGRWARRVAPRVGKLHVVDASAEALASARRNLEGHDNVVLHQASFEALPFEPGSLDFAYALGVLHHVPDTGAALAAAARILKPGAPFLLYLYYALENRPAWYRALFRVSDAVRRAVASFPDPAKAFVCDAAALFVYWPLARLAGLAEIAGADVASLPLASYRSRSLYTMRTDARDRFGTPLEKRFRREEVRALMESAGLIGVRFSDAPPFWCAVGLRSN